jgi:peroxiredoxin
MEQAMRSFLKSATVVVAAVALLGVLAANFVRADEAQLTAKIGQTAPQFSLQDQNGKTVSLSDYAGKVVVLEWTNPECPVVQRHYAARTMATLQKQYAPQGVAWLAINSTHDTTNAEDLAWSGAQGISYSVLNDASGSTGHSYNAKSTPEMYVIDKTGKLVYSGAIDNDPTGEKTSDRVNYVAKALNEVLAGKPVMITETHSYGCAVHYAK